MKIIINIVYAIGGIAMLIAFIALIAAFAYGSNNLQIAAGGFVGGLSLMIVGRIAEAADLYIKLHQNNGQDN